MLGNLIGEANMPDDVKILPGGVTAVSIDGRMEGDDVAEMLGHAREITEPDGVDGLFSYAEWKRLYGAPTAAPL